LLNINFVELMAAMNSINNGETGFLASLSGQVNVLYLGLPVMLLKSIEK